ncbi:putative polymerase with PALM domain, HD hydrolase domain and Zn ribbon [Thermanaerovibrio velox DSM 12556]|uniref:Putative polymerase with PALM domain, HD hydrolase domain and Zn ribbon n=1 Tax=Thermanaerovibrio velox DSM 12556 TaxID=926567 RepID=H0UQ58_9BACT|nr:FapA family protein [Thermanaerovibrio velox]EHM10696.1 putative polymerase with PALM domain, HD hydrolase domain and Zn ribbon [Thermanaerovibrio velox DSM 12556]
MASEERDRGREELLAENLERFIAGIEETFKELGLDAKDSRIDGSYRLEVSGDGMEARVDLFPPLGGGKPLDWLVVVDELSSQGLKGLLTEVISAAVDRCNAGEVVKAVLVAKGVPPLPPREGKVEVLFPLGMEEMEQGDEKVPLHLRKVLRVKTVRPGDRLAVFHPPVPGRPGQDVWGNVIDVPDVKEVHLMPGKGVEVKEDGRTFVATAEGQPVLDGVVLRVDPVFEVRGDVGVATGNVKFDGSIVVRGSVSAGFSVEAGVDAEVFGGVFDGTVRCGRDGVIHGGLVGMKALIEAGGSVLVRYVEHGAVVCDGPVTIEKYSLNGRVSSGESVVVKGRRGVIGGHVQALKLIDSTVAGSEMGTKTSLAVGDSFRVKEQLAREKKNLAEVVAAVLRAENFVKAVLPKVKDAALLRDDLKEKLRKAMTVYDGLKKQEQELKTKIAMLESLLESSSANGVVRVRGEVYPGVTVEVRGVRREIHQVMRYASFYLGDDGEVTFGPYS